MIVIDYYLITHAVDPVTISIEEAFYSITQPEESVEICLVTKGSLDETITISLQITQHAF